MDNKWLEFLREQGASMENDRVVYALEHTYLCELSTLGAIRAAGDDARSFLHGQFTNDLDQVSPAVSQLSSYCNPKGRMLSTLRIHKCDRDYRLILPREVLAATLKKLIMFRLMAKVDITDESSEVALFGVAGPKAEVTLKALNVDVPQKTDHCVQHDGITAIRLPSENVRVLLIANIQAAIPLWKRTSAKLPVATWRLWDLHDIHSGIPQITASISEAFIPQMTNLDVIGGVSFSKGCYPGQEVVARTHYLGKPNRRMYRVSIAGDKVPAPGSNIYAPEDASQPVGKIVSAQQDSDDSCAALVVLRIEKEADEHLYVGSLSGAKVSVRSLPYIVDAAD